MFSDLAINNAWASVGGIGGWNDADMLEVGNKGLTIAEQRTHFALCKRCFTTLLLFLLAFVSFMQAIHHHNTVSAVSNCTVLFQYLNTSLLTTRGGWVQGAWRRALC